MSDPASPFRHPFVWLRNKFLAGLALAVPLLVTFWILKFVYDFLQGQSTPLLEHMAAVYNGAVDEAWRIDPGGAGFGRVTSFVGFLIPMIFLVALGVMATNFIGVRIVSAMDKLLLSVPIISFIYKSLKQVIEAFRGFGGTRSFKRVVYVEYPSPGMKLIGFVTGQYADPKSGANMSCVFLPGALSPMTGLLIVTETARLEDAPLSIEDAMKMIFSGGLIGPGSMKDSRSRSAAAPVPEEAVQLDFAHLPRAEEHMEPVEK